MCVSQHAFTLEYSLELIAHQGTHRDGILWNPALIRSRIIILLFLSDTQSLGFKGSTSRKG